MNPYLFLFGLGKLNRCAMHIPQGQGFNVSETGEKQLRAYAKSFLSGHTYSGLRVCCFKCMPCYINNANCFDRTGSCISLAPSSSFSPVDLLATSPDDLSPGFHLMDRISNNNLTAQRIDSGKEKTLLSKFAIHDANSCLSPAQQMPSGEKHRDVILRRGWTVKTTWTPSSNFHHPSSF